MNRDFKILGNGQIWDVKGILAEAPQKTFEDLFSGRALGRMAQEFDQSLPSSKKIFSNFEEKGRITGLRAFMVNTGEQGINMAAAIDLAQGTGYIADAINRALGDKGFKTEIASADFVSLAMTREAIPEVKITEKVTEREILLGPTVPIGIKESTRGESVLSLVGGLQSRDDI